MPLITSQDVQSIINKYVINSNINAQSIDVSVLRTAFRHSSHNIKPSYERLEFIGDSVLRLILTHYFFLRYSNDNGGFLTSIKIAIEKMESLSHLTKQLNLQRFIQINQTINNHILEDIFESFVGAFYLSYDYETTYKLVVCILEKEKDFASILYYNDNYKDILLRYFHHMKWGNPTYSHSGNLCSVNDYDGGVLATGHGYTNQISEQNASKNALIKLNIIVNGEIIDWESNKSDSDDDEDLESKIVVPTYNKKNISFTEQIIKKIFKKYSIHSLEISNIDLYIDGVTHPSYVKRSLNEEDLKIRDKCVELRGQNYDRLQFLGGAVIHLIIAEFLFESYVDVDEGFMTRIRSRLENKESLFMLANSIGIDKYCLISHRIELMKGRQNINIVRKSFCGFWGALFLDCGYHNIKYPFVVILKTEININNVIETETNYKELLIALYIKNKWGAPSYEVVGEQGPDHSKRFVVCVKDLKGKIIATSIGSSKKQAEKKVAKKVYQKLIKYLDSKK